MKKLIYCALLILTGCVSGTHILTGTARPSIVPEGVKVYSTMPANAETIGIVTANFSDGNGQSATEKVIAELKRQAGQLGANGVIIGNVNSKDKQATTIFSSTGDVGFGSTNPSLNMTGTAIFVP